VAGRQHKRSEHDPPHSPIDLPSIPDVVYEQLRRDIAHGVYKPGVLRVRPVAERFGVSPTPVREALRRLEADGLVTLRNRQILVRALSPVELEEIFAIRAELESFGAARGAARVADDPALLARLDTLLEELDQVGQQAEEWRSGNEEFHMSIYRAAGMPRLESLIASLWVAVGPYLRLYVGSPQNLVESQEQHREILAALRRGDAAGAAGAMKVHLGAALAALLRGLEDAGAT
jgi:DNA-binding GntR family transcriptional regulator